MAYTSLSDVLARLDVSESELKNLVKERGIQVFMMGNEKGGKKTICFSNEDVDKLVNDLKDEDSFALPVQNHLGETHPSESLDLDVEDGPGGTIMIDAADENVEVDLSEDDDLMIDLGDDSNEKAEISLDGDEPELELEEDELEISNDSPSAMAASSDDADELEISDGDADELEISDSDADLELFKDEDEDEPAPVEAAAEPDEDSGLDLGDDSLDLGLNDDELGLDFDEEDSDHKDLSDMELSDEGASETLSFDSNDETLSISGDDEDGETLDFDGSEDIDLPDDSFSMDDDDIDAEDEDSEMLDVSDDNEDTAYRQPSTKIVDEDGLFVLWPLLIIFCFGVIVFAGVVSAGMIQDIQLEQGIAFGKGFFSDLSTYVKQSVKIPK